MIFENSWKTFVFINVKFKFHSFDNMRGSLNVGQ